MEIRDFWKATLRQDAASMRRFFAPGARVFWHNTNEAFSAEEFIEVNCEYPGAWDGEVERVERIGGLIVTALRVFAAGGGPSFRVVSFFRVQDGTIVSIDEYWGDDGAAAGRKILPAGGRVFSRITLSFSASGSRARP